MVLGSMLRSPVLQQPVLKLEPLAFLKMLVFLEQVLHPLVDGGQCHLLAKGK